MNNYKILAEYYNRDNLVYYIIETSEGKVITMKKDTLDKYKQEVLYEILCRFKNYGIRR